jgi:MFS family permease
MRLVVPARAVSFLGDAITLVVLLLKFGELGRPALISVLLGAFSLPLFAMAPLAGRLVDEYDSRRLLVAAGSVQAVASLGLALAGDVAAIVCWLLALQTAQAITGPAWAALVPRIVGADLVGKAVGMQQSLAAITGLAGSAVGGVLYDAVGYTLTMLIDTATFAGLAAIAAIVQTRRGRRYDAGASTHTLAEDRSPGLSGVAIVKADSLLRLLVPALCLFVLSLEAINVVEVFLVRIDLGGTPTEFGLISAAFMLGQICGPMVAARARTDRDRVTAAAAAAGALAALIACVGLSSSVWLLYPLYGAGGVAGGIINGSVGTLVVTSVDDAVRGRVLSVLTGATRGASVLAMAVGGLLGQLVGARITYVICGAVAGVVALMVLRARQGAGERVSSAPLVAETMEA